MAAAQVENERRGTEQEDHVRPVEEIEERRKRIKFLEELDKEKRQRLNDKEATSSSVNTNQDKVLNLKFVAKQCKDTPSFKGEERTLNAERMLLSIVKVFTFSSLENGEIKFSTWEKLLNSNTNSMTYKYYFPKNKEEDEEYCHFFEKFKDHTKCKFSELIWRYCKNIKYKNVTCALLVKLFESSERGSKDLKTIKKNVGELILSRATQVFRADREGIWQLKLTLPDEKDLRKYYTKALFPDQLHVADEIVRVESPVQCNLVQVTDDESDDDAILPESSYKIKKDMATKILLINDSQLAIKSIRKSLEQQEKIYQLAIRERDELQNRLKVATTSEELVSSVMTGIPPTTEGLKLISDFERIISNILRDPNCVQQKVLEMNEILTRYAAMSHNLGDQESDIDDNMEVAAEDEMEPFLAHSAKASVGHGDCAMPTGKTPPRESNDNRVIETSLTSELDVTKGVESAGSTDDNVNVPSRTGGVAVDETVATESLLKRTSSSKLRKAGTKRKKVDASGSTTLSSSCVTENELSSSAEGLKPALESQNTRKDATGNEDQPDILALAMKAFI